MTGSTEKSMKAFLQLAFIVQLTLSQMRAFKNIFFRYTPVICTKCLVLLFRTILLHFPLILVALSI
jgi:hypothetical protein